MAVARINGKIISWALRRSGASLESLATGKVTPQRIAAWAKGEEFPSESQAEDLADRLGIAYPMLFMSNVPPDQPLKMPDLRTSGGQPLRNPSPGLLKVLDVTRARQDWYRAEAKETNQATLTYVGQFGRDVDASIVAAHMRTLFNIDPDARREFANYEDFFKHLVSKAEELGVLVMRSAIAGHATRRILDVKEFRGFALPDQYAPVVFINDNDAKAAQIFTFAHEVAHIWLGAPGISDRPPNDKGSANSVEIKCDAIAAEFLVPEHELIAFWNTDNSLDKNLWRASKHFNVSSLVILRRAKDLDLISRHVFFIKVNEQYDNYKRIEKEKVDKAKKGQKSKGNFWNSFEIRNSRRFNNAVVSAVKQQRTTYAEAGILFGINPAAASKYFQKIDAK